MVDLSLLMWLHVDQPHCSLSEYSFSMLLRKWRINLLWTARDCVAVSLTLLKVAVAELEKDPVCTTHVLSQLLKPWKSWKQIWKNATPRNSQSSGYLFVLGGG